ncbi:calcium-binding protein [Microvirga vignae]|uniref:calcium-binding protein n=1 Tax=Microvirga vignae TaxID=1225564 RepID=UPI00069BF4FD|nr:calcium-binding protein [Microvirga vignae]
MTFKIWGTENSVRLGNSLDRDAIIMLPNGGYVVTWRENQKINFQLYDGNGVKSGDVHFVTSDLSQQFSDVFAYDADGGFVITWTETNAENQRDLRSQKFNFDGSANGTASTLSTTSVDGAQMSANNQGGWATAYVDSGEDSGGLKLVQYDSSGTPGTPVLVSSASGATNPDVTWLGGTTHVVSYRSQAANSGISFRIVNGSSVGAAIGISNATGADVVALKDPATGLPNGNFAVIIDKGTVGIEARFYNSAGTPLKDTNGNDIITSIGGAKPNSDFDCVSITALKGGGFAVAYIAEDGGDFGDVFVRVIDANGVAGNPIKVNARAGVDSFGSQRDPHISEMADGRLSVSWHDPTLGSGLISATIVDLRTSKVTVTGTTHNDVYAASEFEGDTLDGGDGIDTLTFKESTDGVGVDLAAGNGIGGIATGDTYKNFENIIGSRFNDSLSGNALSNTIQGGAGNDTLNGVAGADRLEGGTGNDLYYVHDAGDRVVETSTGGTIDIVLTSVSYTLANYVERLYASGSAAINLTGNSLSNVIKGNAGSNKIYGGAGNDVLYGGTGTGRDIFVFDKTPSSTSNRDRIVDWNRAYDTIQLENAVFKKLTKTGTLSSSFFKISSKALDANDYIGYDKATGNLWYDSNGNASGGQVVFANIGAKQGHRL